MDFPHEIFKAYDIRGIVDRTLTEDMVRRIGQALGSEARGKEAGAVVLGRDGRQSGERLSGALAAGLRSVGCDVIDIGQVPTPALYFATREFGTGTGVQVTGSHNPPQYNGLKMMVDGVTLSGEAIQGIKRRVLDGDVLDGRGSYAERDILDTYCRRILEDVRLAKPLDVVIDCGNGVGGAVAGRIFRGLGCGVTELYCDVDGTFPNHHPDPSQPENLADLAAWVVETGADVGLAFDGDADRLGAVAPDGTIIWADRLMLLFARNVLGERPDSEIIFDVKCSQVLPADIAAHGGRPTMWKTGHSFIKARLRETGAALAGEMSGHIFFNDRWGGFDDGLYAGARLCELLAADSRPAADVFGELPDTVNTPELRLEMEEGDHFRLMEVLAARASFPDAEISRIDGIRADFEDGFGLIRPSNTTPALILRFEATSGPALARIQEEFRRLLLECRPNLSLPF